MTTHTRTVFPLILGSIGVVYGDIGTSPLYAFRESLAASGSVAPGSVLGLLSLIFWTLLIIVTFKYVLLLLRADNGGEGGILALMTLVQQKLGREHAAVLLLGMAGAALFYGDALITPAISVLSAVEGLKVVSSGLVDWIIPIAVVILIALFVFQRHGTSTIGRLFGPFMTLWFVLMAAGGLPHIIERPEVLQAMHPAYAVEFMFNHGWAGLVALGAVFLAVTGAEALYADLGHFGKKPIRLAWMWLVMPSLVINYFGQGALVLSDAHAAENSFFLLYPQWAQLPMVITATIATVIASQAVISGAYSMTHQAMQLGILPRMHVDYHSDKNIGEIYVPAVNWMLLAGVLLLIDTFRTSQGLAAAYGIAVTGTMVITTLLLAAVMRRNWGISWAVTMLVTLPLVLTECVFLGANLTKLLHGGYLPLLLSAMIVFLMRTWRLGNKQLRAQLDTPDNSIAQVIEDIKAYRPTQVSGTAVYITISDLYAPTALLQNLRHNKVIHEQNILVTLEFVNQPFIADEARVKNERIGAHFTKVSMRFGYMERPQIVRGLRLLNCATFEWDAMGTSFFLSQRNIVGSSSFGMPLWRDRIFIAMANMSSQVGDYIHLPFSRVVEVGTRITV